MLNVDVFSFCHCGDLDIWIVTGDLVLVLLTTFWFELSTVSEMSLVYQQQSYHILCFDRSSIHKHFRTIRVSIVHMFTWPTFLTNVFFNLHCFAKWYILPHCLQLCPHAGHCCLDFTCRLPQYLQLISGIRLTDLAFSFIRGILPLLTVSARYILPFSIAFSTDLQISIIFFRVSACSRDKICCVVVSLISRTILSRINELT